MQLTQEKKYSFVPEEEEEPKNNEKGQKPYEPPKEALSVAQGKLADIQFFGDFFGSGDTARLSQLLLGCPYRREDVLHRLETVDLETYIHNVTPAQLAELIVEWPHIKETPIV